MHDNVLWLVRSSQKDTESTVFSNLPTKIGEEPHVLMTHLRGLESIEILDGTDLKCESLLAAVQLCSVSINSRDYSVCLWLKRLFSFP